MHYNIEFKNVSVKHAKCLALNNVSLTIAEEKIYGLIGRNGAGKTTMLSLLASFREPTSGNITINGDNPFDNNKILPYVSFIYQVDYREESRKIEKLIKEEARYRANFDIDYARKLAQRFKLPLNKPIKKLSTGMQSAFNVTIALASRSPITIFDEAYQGMDVPSRAIFYEELLKDQSRYPRIIILSTHIVSEMEYLFDEIILIDKGEIIVQEDYHTFISKGQTITGSSDVVDPFTNGLKKLNEEQLGNTKRISVYGKLSDTKIMEAKQLHLTLGTASLQDMFIYLTKEEEIA